jgi:hypothetical protein
MNSSNELPPSQENIVLNQPTSCQPANPGLSGLTGFDIQTGIGLNLKTEMGFRALAIAHENIKLLDRKQQDYGPGNIAAFGEYGVLVRMSDKFERLKNLLKSKRKKPRNEPVVDSWRDISNYGIIAVLVRKNLWR